jgi:hypothetical protein
MSGILLGVATSLLVLGAVISGSNFYLSFVRYPLFRMGGGRDEAFRNVSGIPLFGSLLLWVAAAMAWQEPWVAFSSLAISLLDTGGLHWFVGMMLWHYSRR